MPDGELEEYERQPFPVGQRIALRQSFHWSLPDCESVNDASIGDAYDIYEQFNLNYLNYDLYVTTGTFALGGYPSIVHTDPCNEVREVHGNEDWLLLAEASNYFTDSYSYAGYVYWVIRRQDLIERRFDRVKTLMQGIG